MKSFGKVGLNTHFDSLLKERGGAYRGEIVLEGYNNEDIEVTKNGHDLVVEAKNSEGSYRQVISLPRDASSNFATNFNGRVLRITVDKQS